MIKKIIFIIQNPHFIIPAVVNRLPYFSFLKDTLDYQNRVSFYFWFKQKVLNLGGNKHAYWPVHWTSQVYDVENILIGIDAYPGIMKGCYIQGKGGIEIGNYTQIAPNVIIVSANHNVYDNREHISSPVKIGSYCWLGAGSKIMPGVNLGDWTVVGAGAVVTKSFPEGFCVIGGIPAKILKYLDKEKCIPYTHEIEYNGYIRSDKFPAFRKKFLKI